MQGDHSGNQLQRTGISYVAANGPSIQESTHNMNITIKFSGNSINVPFTGTVGELLRNENFAAVLGFDAANAEGYLDGVALPTTNTLHDGDVIVVQQKAHGKASGGITLKFSGNSITVPFTGTFGELLGNENFAAVLGFDAANAEGYIDGVAQPATGTVREGDTIVIQQKAHGKAVIA